MGNYSYLIDQESCIINVDKVRVLCKLKGIGGYIGEDFKKLTKDGLGNFIDGWKIQGYWYDEFITFLYCCADCMKDLTEEKRDNYLEMEEEQGFKFIIYFFKEKGETVVEVDYVPMEWQTMKLKNIG